MKKNIFFTLLNIVLLTITSCGSSPYIEVGIEKRGSSEITQPLSPDTEIGIKVLKNKILIQCLKFI